MASERQERSTREEAPTYFLLDAPAQPGATIELPPEEAHHALRVLRLAAGAIVPASDGRGCRYRLELIPQGRACAALVLDRVAEEPPAPVVEVGLGAGRRERFLWCVEKLTELQVARITPLLSETVQSRRALAGEAGRRWSEKARARAAAALKQSKGAHLPEVAAPEDAALWRRREFRGVSLLLAFPGHGVMPVAAAAAGRAALVEAAGVRIAVGPEGGFLPAEESAFDEAGFVRAHLGARRLRFETAALAAVCHVGAALALQQPPASGRREEGPPWSS